MRASLFGYIDIVNLLLEKGADSSKMDNIGFTALGCAAENGHTAVVTSLLESGVNIDATPTDGSTPLVIAITFGHNDAALALIEHGANVNIPDSYGQTPLILAAKSEAVGIINQLLKAGADVNAQAEDGAAALHFAARQKNTECASLLLDNGAAVNMPGNNNCSAVQIAVGAGNIEMAKLLISRGADVNLRDNDGDTALHETIYQDKREGTRFLLDHGADINAENGVGWTPLVGAAQRGRVEISNFLLEKGAAVDSKTSDGRTGLFLAAEEGHLDIVRALLDKGAAVNIVDSENQTPLMKAAYRGHDEIVEILLDNDTDVYLKDTSGRTATGIARFNCRNKVMRILQRHQAERAVPPGNDRGNVVTLKREKPDWFIPSREVRKDQQPFSAGSFGQVYRGWWLSTRVVVKTVTVANEKESRTFHREARIWQKARHPNIVPFFGACDEGSTYFFVCEEAKNGKLLDYLYHAREEGRSLVWRKLLDAALGLHFLHERHIVHSDLKCNQILVSKDGVTMLTDFGLSFLATEQSGDEETVGAIRWKAPEVIRKDKPVAPNAQSDVYSFGMCVVEAVTCDVPWGQQVSDPVVKFHVTRKKFMPRPKTFESDAQWELVLRLCAFEPSERMKFADAIEVIRGFAEEERFQERLQEMKEEIADDLSDIGVGVKEPAKLPKMTMESVQALAKVKSIGHSIRAKRGVGRQVAAA